MIDPLILKARYAAMSDEELMQFAVADGNALTPEAFGILKNEFLSRKLDTAILLSIESGTYSEYLQSINQIENTMVKEFSTTMLAHVMNEKRDGKSDAEITSELIENGMEEQAAAVLITQLEKNARNFLSKAKNNMLTGFFICMAGVACYLISPRKPVVTFLDIISICAIGIGILIILKNWFDANKYTTVIKNVGSATHHD